MQIGVRVPPSNGVMLVVEAGCHSAKRFVRIVEADRAHVSGQLK